MEIIKYILVATSGTLAVADSTQTGSRLANNSSPLQRFIDAQKKLETERVNNKDKGINTVLGFIKQGISIAPNPATNYTNITCKMGKETKQAYLLVTDVTGKVLQRIALQTESYSYTLEISNFAKGFYHVCLYEDGIQTDCKKLIIK